MSSTSQSITRPFTKPPSISRWLVDLGWLALGIIWMFSAVRVGFTPWALLEGLPQGLDYLSRVFPPDLRILPRLWPSILDTYAIAITSIPLAVLIALPLSFLGSWATTPHPLVYYLTRALFNNFRGFPTVFLAMLLVSMLGLGPLPAVVALVIHNVGALGRYFSEAAEAAELKDTAESMMMDGANTLQITIHNYIPALQVLYAGYIWYYFEYSVRASTFMGLVGAGGLGLHMAEAVGLFRYRQVGTIVLVILAMVLANDLIGIQIRRKLKES